MSMNVLWLLLSSIFAVVCGCQQKHDEPHAIQNGLNVNRASTQPDTLSTQWAESETFVDSTMFGRKGRCKIEVVRACMEYRSITRVRLYVKDGKGWNPRDSCTFESDDCPSLNASVSDFNGDKLNDLVFTPRLAGRGANELLQLVVYNDTSQRLTVIVNSDEYPNLRYFSELDYLEAYRFYSGYSTEYLRVDADSLKLYASIETNDSIETVSMLDRQGQWKIIRQTIVSSDSVDENDPPKELFWWRTHKRN